MFWFSACFAGSPLNFVFYFLDHQYLWHSALGGPVPEHQADRHQCDGSGEVPAHVEREELLHSGLRGPVRPVARRRGGHPAAPGCGAQGGGSEHKIGAAGSPDNPTIPLALALRWTLCRSICTQNDLNLSEILLKQTKTLRGILVQ